MEATIRTLPVPLTLEEQAELGGKISEILLQVEQLEKEKKNITGYYGDEIKDKTAEAIVLSKQFRDLTKEVEIDCVWIVNDPVPGKKTLRRTDTQEVVETQDMGLFDTSPKALPEAIQEAEILEIGVPADEVKAAELAEEIFEELLIKRGSENKLTINSPIEDLRWLIWEHRSEHLSIQIIDELVKEYLSPGGNEFILIQKSDYKPFKALLTKLLSEYQDKPESSQESALALESDMVLSENQ